MDQHSQLKFTVPFQGGDDGISPHNSKFTGNESQNHLYRYTTGANLYGFDVNQQMMQDIKDIKKQLDILSNQDEYDINMLAIPGVINKYILIS